MYVSITELLNNKLPNPERLDELTAIYQGLHIHIYGILHGVSGGTNQEYRDLVDHTISMSKGLRFCEKGMTSFYKGLDKELHDWDVMRLSDIIKLTLVVHGVPWRTLSFLKILLKERLTKTDKFKKTKVINNLGGSPQFHLLEPNERRQLAGFPLSMAYLNINIQRRHGKNTFKLAPAFDEDWKWLNWIEPYANLPLRSIWMIEYALEYAKQHNLKEISLFVGETHNTDIIHYLNNKNTLSNNNDIQNIIIRAKTSALRNFQHKFNFGHIKYIAGIIIGMSIPAIYYLAAILLFKRYN